MFNGMLNPWRFTEEVKVKDKALVERDALYKEIKELETKYDLLHYWVVDGGKSQFKTEMRQTRKRLEKLRAVPMPKFNHIKNTTGCKDYFEYDKKLSNIKKRINVDTSDMVYCAGCGDKYREIAIVEFGGQKYCSDCYMCEVNKSERESDE